MMISICAFAQVGVYQVTDKENKTLIIRINEDETARAQFKGSDFIYYGHWLFMFHEYIDVDFETSDDMPTFKFSR